MKDTMMMNHENIFKLACDITQAQADFYRAIDNQKVKCSVVDRKWMIVILLMAVEIGIVL